MTVSYYMDQNFHGDVTAGLRQRGIDCLTAEEDGTSEWDDVDLLARATALQRVLVSSDRDLLDVAGARQASGREFSGVVHGHQYRITVGGAIADLVLIHNVHAPDELRNQTIRMPL